MDSDGTTTEYGCAFKGVVHESQAYCAVPSCTGPVDFPNYIYEVFDGVCYAYCLPVEACSIAA